MSTIHSTAANGYVSLGNTSTSGSSSNSAGNLADALASLTGTGNTTKTTSNSATNSYLLDLSEAAQAYLSKMGSQTQSTAKASGNENFLLTNAQTKQLQNIVEKYKDAPYTQDTFNQIQDDLDAAGLSPQTMSTKEHVRNINPTQFLLDALGGKSGLSDIMNGTNDQEVLKTKSDNYMEKIKTMWESISTTKDDKTTTGSGEASA